MARIRKAVEYAQRVLDLDCPLLSQRFLTHGREIFLRDSATHPHFTNLNRYGQVAWSQLEMVLREVDYEELRAVRWWPAGRDTRILIDPRLNFGRPVLADIGVRTETLVDRWVAGLTLSELGQEYSADPAFIEKAVRFENRSGAIAA